jgi:hypothetical protein
MYNCHKARINLLLHLLLQLAAVALLLSYSSDLQH